MLKSYKVIKDDNRFYIKKSTIILIIGYGMEDLQLSARRTPTLTKVNHRPKIQKSILLIFFLSHHGFLVIFESNKKILSKNG